MTMSGEAPGLRPPGQPTAPLVWQPAGQSVRGSKHRRQGQPTQDAIAWGPAAEGVALAVADGHGSAPSFRSHVGARLAVEAAITLLAEYAQRQVGKVLSALPAEDGSWLARQLSARWRQSIRAHAEAQPFTTPLDEEAAAISYGTTLLAALVTPAWLLCCQLGDGDILIVSDSGQVRRPWARDQRLLGVETTSLCMPEAWREVRLSLEPLLEPRTPRAPALVLLSTDGYANSFRNERGFLRVGRDMLELVRTQGMARVERDLEGWLNEASDLGSGDDITVGLLYRSRDGGR